MTAGGLKTLNQAQGQTVKGGNLAELNHINKMLFEERERRQKTREQEREKVLSAEISAFCEKMLSAENSREL